MYQVTIISQDCEIGYGEGESLAYAQDEAAQSIDGMGLQYLTAFGGQALIIMADGTRMIESVTVERAAR
jgi:hypothetical protein